MHFEMSSAMMTSSIGNLFRGTGHLRGEFTGHRWIPRTKAVWRRALMFSLICARIKGWVNNREAGDMRRHRTNYDVTVMGNGCYFSLATLCRLIVSFIVIGGMQHETPTGIWGIISEIISASYRFKNFHCCEKIKEWLIALYHHNPNKKMSNRTRVYI